MSDSVYSALVPQCGQDTLLTEVHHAKSVVLATAQQLMPICMEESDDTRRGVATECFEQLCEAKCGIWVYNTYHYRQ